jgi:site-specific DNA-methyltransferase (adenine-specific)
MATIVRPTLYSCGVVAPVEMEQNEVSEMEGAPCEAAHIQVRRGDAYDLMADLPEESIDLLITSPPYWGLRTYGQEHNEEILKEWLAEDSSRVQTDVPPYDWYRKHGGVLGLEPLPEWFIGHLVEIFQRGAHALKPRGSMWVNIGDTYFARWSSIRHDGRQGLGDNPRSRRRTPMGGYRQEKQLLLIPARFAIAMQDRRWILRNDLIWHKPNVPPRPEKDRLRLAHEHFFHFVKRPKEGRPKYHYDMAHVENGARDVAIYDFDASGYEEADPAYYDYQEVDANDQDVVTTHVRSGSDGHSATFPVGLIKPRILSSCPPGGTVLDPFCGTGRALTVAAETGRKAVGFELSTEFHEAATKNTDQVLGQLTIDVPEVE